MYLCSLYDRTVLEVYTAPFPPFNTPNSQQHREYQTPLPPAPMVHLIFPTRTDVHDVKDACFCDSMMFERLLEFDWRF